MKIGLVLLAILLLPGCSTGFDPDIGDYFVSTPNAIDSDERPPKNGLNILAKKLVAEMLSNNQFVTKQNAIAVTSIVDLNSLSKTNRLGHQVSEGIVHYLHNSGYRVVDFKLTGTIQVTAEGDFIHSRDWKLLNDQQPVDYLVSGTIDQYESGSYLSMRMVGIQTRVVVASSQAFISAEQLQAYIANPESMELATQRAQLKAEKEKFAQEVEQRNGAHSNEKINQPSSQVMDDSEAKNQKVHVSNGFLVRE